MLLTCIRPKCARQFDETTYKGYCPTCVIDFIEMRKAARRAANPQPGTMLDGQFLDPKNCPQTVEHPVRKERVCGCCGSNDLEDGYGFAGGYGLGVYTFCHTCSLYLNFVEDSDE